MKTQVIDIEDFVWLSGLLEGDGSFYGKPSSTGKVPVVKLAMTDRKIVQEASEILGVNVGKPYRNHGSTKDVYKIDVQGYGGAKLMMKLRPLMGPERQDQIDRVLQNTVMPNPRKTSKDFLVSGNMPDEKYFLCWLVGFLEAEAWFGLRRDRYLAIEVQATARDCIERIAKYFDRDVRRIEFDEEQRSVQWNVALKSSVEAAAVLEILLPLMRGEKKERVSTWLSQDGVLTASEEIISGRFGEDYYSARAS